MTEDGSTSRSRSPCDYRRTKRSKKIVLRKKIKKQGDLGHRLNLEEDLFGMNIIIIYSMKLIAV